MPELRPYQKEACAAAWKAWDEGHPALLSMATGVGKTIIFSELARQSVKKKNWRVCICVHLQELVRQASDKLSTVWDGPQGFVCASVSHTKNADAPVTVSSMQSLLPLLLRDESVSFDALYIDEAHHIPPPNEESSYSRIINLLRERNPNLRILGVTATPFRLKQGNIFGKDAWFPTLNYEYSVRRGQDEHWLVPCDTRAPVDVNATVARDLKNVPISHGDYRRKALSDVMRAQRHLHDAVCAINDYAEGRNHIAVYAVDIGHAETLAAELRKNGVTADCVHSKREDRARVFQAFADGDIRALVSVDMLTEGWDFPAVDCLVCCAPTKSTSRYLQLVGRGLRPAPGKKDCLHLDLASNSIVHGTARNPRLPGDRKEDVRIVACPRQDCGAINGVIPGKSKTYFCWRCGEDLREVANIVKFVAGDDGKRKKKDPQEAPIVPLLPIDDSDETLQKLRRGANLPMLTMISEEKTWSGGQYLRYLFYCKTLHGMIPVPMVLDAESQQKKPRLEKIWNAWGKGQVPNSHAELIRRWSELTVPNSIPVKAMDNGIFFVNLPNGGNFNAGFSGRGEFNAALQGYLPAYL